MKEGRFLKYRIAPFILFCGAVGITLTVVFTVHDLKTIPDGIKILFITLLIFIWAVTIDVNNDAHHKELRDIIKSLTDTPSRGSTK